MYDIRKLFLFNGLAEGDRDCIISTLTECKGFAKGETIYSADAFQNAMGIFLTGRAEAVSENVVKKNFIEGDIFGVG